MKSAASPISGMRSAAISAVGAACLCLIVGAAGVVATAGTASASPSFVGVSSPASGHPYRFGAMPIHIRGRAGSAFANAATSSPGLGFGTPIKHDMTYNSGPVQAGQPKVYLVFWGSQWGTQTTSGGYQVFSGDPDGMAQYLEAFYRGLGTGGETWSATAGQYCQGIAVGSTSCPTSSAYVAYPTSGVLAGIWEDTSYTPPTGPPASPSTPGATGLQIQQEAANAAVHFGDSSIDAQYVVVSPTGTDPDGWAVPKTGYCAYHSYTGDTYFGTVVGPNVPYTNLPYIPDAALSTNFGCTEGLIPYPNHLDGTTEAAGHEYYETLTDPFQRSGWADAKGYEIGDKCDYLNPGLPGAETSLTLSTGSFPVQGMWSNQDNQGKGGCVDTSSPIIITNPGKKVSAVMGSPVGFSISAYDVLPGATVAFAASGLPTGVSINPVTGEVSGTPLTKGSSVVTVVVTDSSSNFASVSFKMHVAR